MAGLTLVPFICLSSVDVLVGIDGDGPSSSDQDARIER